MFPHNTQTYHDWNEQIAINNVDLLHKQDRELKAVHFAEIFMSSDPFDKLDISTLLRDVKSLLKFPCMVAVGNDWEGGGSGSQTHSVINGSFIILDKMEVKNTDRANARRAAYTKTERIAQEISGYIRAYMEANVRFGHLVAMPVGEKIGPVNIDGECYGCKVSYSYVSRYSYLYFDQDKFGELVPGVDEEPGESSY
jgi:hypothetical protein